MFTTMLCATDGSEHAHRAVEVAADLGQRYRARVFVVTAYDPLLRELGSPYLEDLTAKRIAAAEMLAGDAAHVLTARGAALLGSVSMRVIQEASCSVLITR